MYKTREWTPGFQKMIIPEATMEDRSAAERAAETKETLPQVANLREGR
jgi:hypothetical protein